MGDRELLTYYFETGYAYEEILQFLRDRHDLEMSLSTLKRRLRLYGLKRKGNIVTNEKMQDLRSSIQNLVDDGAWSSLGYRTTWQLLKCRGFQVPRSLVETVLREVDPEGTEARRRHQLRRRKYNNLGPDYAWHIDGHDWPRLKPFGFPIHGAIDGYSRRILWLKVVRSNNSPEVIVDLYLNCVVESNGCPKKLISDLGTENGLAATAQCYFRQNIDAHRYVPSPRNQRIEGWWS